jgi:DNA-binding Lrp family transcriptional regulator
MPGQRPFELSPAELVPRLEEMVDATFSDLVSEFLLMPLGKGFIKYSDFREAYEVLKAHTHAFDSFEANAINSALFQNSRVLGVLRAILGMTAPEWAELAHSELNSDVSQNAARTLDRKCREDARYVRHLSDRYQAKLDNARQRGLLPPNRPKSLERIGALVEVAIQLITRGAPLEQEGVIHRLAKFDTYNGLQSLKYASSEHVPFAVLLYERYLGRPFAGHRDAVSELVGEVMENAIEERLRKAGVSYRKTGRAERIPGFGQAPDFCIPDEVSPVVVIESKITSDDGTARDKVARIKELETQRNEHVAAGRPHYDVVACIDGRGFRQRREDMRQLLLRLDGKVFTTCTLDHLISHTRIGEFVSKS